MAVDVSGFLVDCKQSFSLSSSVPPSTRSEECCMGIDEAGRGPVLGPMVYGTCFCPINRKESLQATGVADSKVLSEDQRESLFGVIESSSEFLGWKVEILSPDHISNCMLRRSKYSLNALSHDTAISLIRKVIAAGVNLTEVYVDTVGPPEKYQEKLQQLFPSLSVTVAKKADSLFPVVSAASICAKVIRDECVKQWQFVERGVEFSRQFGSGYPSDPQTKQWLKEQIDPVFGYPTLVRFSWATCRDALDGRAADIQWPDDEEDTSAIASFKINQLFAPKSENPAAKRHRFFAERGLSAASDL